jgi:stage IV sporulation protein FB
VYLFEPTRTQFDLNFRIFGIDVRVHPMFWFVTAILGSGFERLGIAYLASWIVVVFFSVLIHELGHVLMGRMFGSFGHIVLYGFGGLAIGSSNLDRRWQRNLVYVAGPVAQFMLLGVALAVLFICLANRAEMSKLAWTLLTQLIWVNSFWPILNLLPIWPLDGGRISRETFEWLMPERGTATSLIVSMIVAAGLAINSLLALKGVGIFPSLLGDMYLGLFFALFAVNNFQEWQMVRYRARHPWDNEPDRW